jgi:TolB-like protein
LLISAQLVTGFSGEDAFGATETSARIAVVPFRTAYGDNASVLSDGLLTELQYELVNGSDMVVISPDDKYLTADTMSLTGCVSIGQDEVRVTATITDNTSGVITWSRVFERPRSDLLTMPADFAREIVAALPSEISASQGGKNAG